MGLNKIKIVCPNKGVRWVDKLKLNLFLKKGWKTAELSDVNVVTANVVNGVICSADSSNKLVLCYKPCSKKKQKQKKWSAGGDVSKRNNVSSKKINFDS